MTASNSNLGKNRRLYLLGGAIFLWCMAIFFVTLATLRFRKRLS